MSPFPPPPNPSLRVVFGTLQCTTGTLVRGNTCGVAGRRRVPTMTAAVPVSPMGPMSHGHTVVRQPLPLTRVTFDQRHFGLIDLPLGTHFCTDRLDQCVRNHEQASNRFVIHFTLRPYLTIGIGHLVQFCLNQHLHQPIRIPHTGQPFPKRLTRRHLPNPPFHIGTQPRIQIDWRGRCRLELVNAMVERMQYWLFHPMANGLTEHKSVPEGIAESVMVMAVRVLCWCWSQ